MKIFSSNVNMWLIQGFLIVFLVSHCASLPLDDDLTFDLADSEAASNSTTEAPWSNSSDASSSATSASTLSTMLPGTTATKPTTEATTAGSTASTAAPTTPSPPPPPPPPPSRGFDVGSFFGGIVLGVGLLVLGYFAYTFYKRRSGHSYQQM